LENLDINIKYNSHKWSCVEFNHHTKLMKLMCDICGLYHAYDFNNKSGHFGIVSHNKNYEYKDCPYCDKIKVILSVLE